MLARCGSVRRVSEKLYVAASAVNRQILKLEGELGVELFDRIPNGMRLNAAGERLLRHVQTTPHDIQLTRSELDALKGDVVWRPFDLPDLNQLKVGILAPTQRALPHVTQTFVERLTRRLGQLESVAATL